MSVIIEIDDLGEPHKNEKSKPGLKLRNSDARALGSGIRVSSP